MDKKTCVGYLINIRDIFLKYKTGLIIVPEYMDVYVAKTNKYIAKTDTTLKWQED